MNESIRDCEIDSNRRIVFMEPWSTLVVLGVGIIVFAWFMPKSRPESGEKDKKEVEAVLEQYLAEIELENEKVIQSIQKWKQDYSHLNTQREKEIQEINEKVNSLEHQFFSLADHVTTLQALPLNNQEGSDTDQKLNIADNKHTAVDELTIHTRYTEIFELESKGKSTDYIARKLEIPKGEVELILQLGERERMV